MSQTAKASHTASSYSNPSTNPSTKAHNAPDHGAMTTEEWLAHIKVCWCGGIVELVDEHRRKARALGSAVVSTLLCGCPSPTADETRILREAHPLSAAYHRVVMAVLLTKHTPEHRRRFEAVMRLQPQRLTWHQLYWDLLPQSSCSAAEFDRRLTEWTVPF